MIIALQGELGSFHHAAAEQFFARHDFEVQGHGSFRAVFESLMSGASDYAVVAVENSLYGSIHETFDQLLRHDCSIIGEITLPVHQCLLVPVGVSLGAVREVASHPAALDQCRGWLDAHLPGAARREHADTAGAAAELAVSGRTDAAVIASARAAELHGLTVLAPNIEDEPDNVTRFVVLSRTPQAVAQANKASLVLVTDHQPGALHEALGIISANHSNMTKIESRPMRGQPFRYQFIIDVMADQTQLISLCHQLEEAGCRVQVLGHYRAAR